MYYNTNSQMAFLASYIKQIKRLNHNVKNKLYFLLLTAINKNSNHSMPNAYIGNNIKTSIISTCHSTATEFSVEFEVSVLLASIVSSFSKHFNTCLSHDCFHLKP